MTNLLNIMANITLDCDRKIEIHIKVYNGLSISLPSEIKRLDDF